MRITLKVWRQENGSAKGGLVEYKLDDVNPDMSFLEMLDLLNEQLIKAGDSPVEFDSDCREGICGSCGLVVNGQAHGPHARTAVCQLHMRHFMDGDDIVIEPWRAKAFPVVRDLVVDRSAFDRMMYAGGFISVNTGSAPDAHSILVDREAAEEAMDYASCIGCGACVAACPNSSASLFLASRIAHLALLPQGEPERKIRARRMVDQMEEEGFGDCSNYAECEAVCPKGISIHSIAIMRREFLKANFAA